MATVFQGRRTELHDAVARRLKAQEPGDVVARAFSDGVAELVRAATPNAPGIAVLGQGGLARRDLVPFSDVDVLILVDDADAIDEATATKPLYALWDAGFRVGHAVRAAGELAVLFDSLHEKDGHAATALLEARFIAGDAALAERSLKHVRRDLLPAKRGALVDEKLRELAARRLKHGDSAFAQEPDVKSSPGALRDVHALLWIGLLRAGEGARGRDDGDLIAGLLGAGVLHPREAEALAFGRRELLTVRAALHLAVGRAEDRLHAANAERAAVLVDAAPAHVGESAPEALCRRAVSAMAVVKRTVDDALARLTADTRAHRVRGFDPRASSPRSLGSGFFAVEGELHIDADAPFDLAAIVDAARLLAEHDVVASEALTSRRAAAIPSLRARAHHGDDVDAGRSLLALASTSYGSSDRAAAPFTRLLEWGALGLVLVEIERLSARVKLDGVHALTTDAHLARCADLALAMVSGAQPPPSPLQASLARTTRPHLVVLAALFHDMGKGLPEDHSVAGEIIVRRECARMGVAKDEIETLAFLVREHLALSRTSQRRDLSDPAVVDEIAALVRTPETLDLLALLTWVDMCAVAPGVGTEWKARLLGDAVARARAVLLAPDAKAARAVDDEVRLHARSLLPAGTVVDRFVDAATARFLSARTDDELRDDFAAFVRYTADEGRATSSVSSVGAAGHEVRLVAPDRPGLLADVAAALASEGANVLHAVLDVRSDGVALDSFVVDDGRGGRLPVDVAPRLPSAVAAAADGSAPRRTRHKSVARVTPRVRVLASDSWGRPVVEVRTGDRIGLLADLASAFAEHGFTVLLARIHTEGPRVTDVFTIDRIDGAHPTEAQLRDLERALLEVIA